VLRFVLPLAVATFAAGPAPPRYAGCQVFPGDNAWNRDISAAPRDPRSDAYVRSIGEGDHVHPDFGSGKYGDYGIPVKAVSKTQKKIPIRYTAYGDESDKGPFPIPLTGVHVEGGSKADGDRHVLVVQKGTCRLYELYRAFRRGKGWSAESGAKYDLHSNKQRPAGWTSADAAGLPIFPGLARADEAAGAIHHALRFTVSTSRKAYVPPARHQAGSTDDPNVPPMGQRFRLKASFSLTPFHGQARVILQALKTYGMILADNGSDWYISGTPDRRWNDDQLDELKTVPGSAFEAVAP
jgi:hypothetical protein